MYCSSAVRTQVTVAHSRQRELRSHTDPSNVSVSVVDGRGKSACSCDSSSFNRSTAGPELLTAVVAVDGNTDCGCSQTDQMKEGQPTSHLVVLSAVCQELLTRGSCYSLNQAFSIGDPMLIRGNDISWQEKRCKEQADR
ncbi:hypothetical protein PHSY_005306 [Pseudozyma hubeiensis SY62]|uniref:Uncharacterized protein n=1 Tax=Pseudozyma hubeiensis (strain SY62) TaxID=1305764 RepID=R9P8P7_PSEHS|nr:hypothetical protein PHSY_005306 [Pseudozyma hubeiensis SY62]GAC97719.1 hypothetical protein PHSY_005306 [Pseudozyma hubeiensis SY62]